MMAIEIVRASSREEWLEKRGSLRRIGGSEAAAVIGLSPWLNNLQLWKIKTGRQKKLDVSDMAAVEYGRKAEGYIRELFRLDFPEFRVWHEENAMILNSKYPWALASLDGMITDPATGRLGILEIKTSALVSALARRKWDGRIPDNYMVQILHYMAVLEADFAVLVAQLTSGHGENFTKTIRHYWIDRSDMEADIEYLMEKEKNFFEYIEKDEEPPLVLPRI